MESFNEAWYAYFFVSLNNPALVPFVNHLNKHQRAPQQRSDRQAFLYGGGSL